MSICSRRPISSSVFLGLAEGVLDLVVGAHRDAWVLEQRGLEVFEGGGGLPFLQELRVPV